MLKTATNDGVGTAVEEYLNRIAYTPNNAARALDVSRSFIFKEIHEGRIEAKKISRRKTLIPADSLIAWLQRRPNTTAAAA